MHNRFTIPSSSGMYKWTKYHYNHTWNTITTGYIHSRWTRQEMDFHTYELGRATYSGDVYNSISVPIFTGNGTWIYNSQGNVVRSYGGSSSFTIPYATWQSTAEARLRGFMRLKYSDNTRTAYIPTSATFSIRYVIDGGVNYWVLMVSVLETTYYPNGTKTEINLDYQRADGEEDGYFYHYERQGSTSGTVTSINRNAYPDSGTIGNVTYSYQGYTQVSDPDVTSQTNDYPADGWQGNYHYTLVETPEGTVIGENHIYGSVEFIQEVNNDQNDLHIGCDSCGQVKFITDLLTSSSIGTTLIYQVMMPSDNSWTTVGKFTVHSATKDDAGRFSVVCYDNMIKFDKVIDDWWANLFPDPNSNTTYQLHQVYSSLCAYCGVTPNSTNLANFTNRTLTIRKNFQPSNLSGRTMMSYIADCAGGFAICNSSGECELRSYASTNIALDNSDYVKLTYADFTVPAISGVSVSLEDDTTPIVVPSGATGNILRITYNPLMFCDTTDTTELAELTTAMTNIWNIVKTIVYVPTEITLFQDFGIKAGDIISVDNKTTIVMSKQWDSKGVSLSCIGQSQRNIQSSYVSESIEMLRGYYSRVKIDVDNISAEVGNLQTDISTTVKLKADGVTITDHSGNTVTITGQCVDASTINASQINTQDLRMTGIISWSDLSSSCQQQIHQEGYTPPSYIKETYIDGSQVSSFSIRGNEIQLRNGALKVMDANGSVSYGYIGIGNGIDASGNSHLGVILSASDDTTLSAQDNYIIANDQGIRIQNGNYSIILDGTGAYYKEPNENPIRLGYARFG